MHVDSAYLFAYGTLMDARIMAGVSGLTRRPEVAVLSEHARRRLRGEVYPGICARAGESVEGVLYPGISREAFVRLDRFESALYVRSVVVVRSVDGWSVDAQAYVVAAEHEAELSDEAWSYADFVANDREAFRRRYATRAATESRHD